MDEALQMKRDEDLVLLGRKGCGKAKNILMERYTPLVKKMCQAPFTKRFREDLEQELWLAFFELVQTFDPARASFSAAAWFTLYFCRQNLFKAQKREWSREVADGEGLFEPAVYDRYPGLEAMDVQHAIEGMGLNPLQKETLGFMMEGMSSVKIAETQGISQQAAYDRMRRIRKKGKKYFQDAL